MTSLPPPPVVSQLSAKLDPWDDCGEACVASALQGAGTPVNLSSVVSTHAGISSEYDLQSLLAHFGLPGAAIHRGPMAAQVPPCLSRGHWVICLITVTPLGVPRAFTGIDHWVTCYAPQWAFMNPLPGQLQGYSLQGCDGGVQVEVPFDCNALEPPPLKPLVCALDGTQYVIAPDLSRKSPVASEPDLLALLATGQYVAVQLTPAQMQSIPTA